jgi:hypothetical protein
MQQSGATRLRLSKLRADISSPETSGVNIIKVFYVDEEVAGVFIPLKPPPPPSMCVCLCVCARARVCTDKG